MSDLDELSGDAKEDHRLAAKCKRLIADIEQGRLARWEREAGNGDGRYAGD